MKKFFNPGRYCLSLLMASALSFTACTEKEDFNLDNNHKLQVTFGVNSHGSRAINRETSLPDGSQVGARLSGYTGYENLVYTASTGKTPQAWTGNKDVVLSDVSGTLYAFYPYNDDIDITAIPVDMTATDQTDWLYGVPATGITDLNPEVDVTMNHALANINLSIVRDTYAGTGEITSISVQSDGIASKGTFNAAQATPGYTAFTVKGEALERSVETTLGATATDIMVIPTGTEAAITFFVTVDDVVYSVKSAPLTLEMGNSYQYTLKLNSTFMSVDGVSVNPWNNVPKEDDLELEEYDEFDAGIVATYYIDEAQFASRAAEGVEVQVLSANSKFYIASIDRMQLDGVEVTPSLTYTFTSGGVHTVKYLLKNNKKVPTHMFNGVASLTNFKLPETITVIDEQAFRNCTGLTGELVIPGHVRELRSDAYNRGAFHGCTGLTTVIFEEGVEVIGDGSFNNCSKLEVIHIPSTIEEIGHYAFAFNNSLREIVSRRIESFETTFASFYTCKSGGRLFVPENAENYSSWMSTGLGDVNWTWYEENEKAIDGIYYSKDGKIAIKGDPDYNGPLNLKSDVETIGYFAFKGCTGFTGTLNIPNSVTGIRFGAFQGCTGLTGSLTLPDQLSSIEGEFHNKAIFKDCTGLTEVIIPNSIKTIGAYTFQGCTGLTSLILGSGLTSIGDYAFSNCKGLKEITLLATKLPTLYQYTFQSVYSVKVKVPAYTTGYDAWLQDVQNRPGYLDWKIREDNEPINGIYYSSDGKIAMMGDPNYSGPILIRDGVETILTNAFRACTGFTGELNIPSSVTSIGNKAFYGCTGLTKVTIPNSVTEIGTLETHSYKGVFQGCIGLTEVTIPESVTSIGESAFEGCKGLMEVAIPNSVTNIGRSAFQECTGLTEVTIPNSVTEIGGEVFKGCTGLTAVTLGSGLNTIGSNAFYGCKALTTLDLGSGVTSIGYEAFLGCSGLNSILVGADNPVYDSRNNCNAIMVTATDKLIMGCNSTLIPEDTKIIGRNAFCGCTFTEITIPEMVKSLESYAFNGCKSLSSILFLGTTPPLIASNLTFNNLVYGGHIIVPNGYLDVYTTWHKNFLYNWTVQEATE